MKSSTCKLLCLVVVFAFVTQGYGEPLYYSLERLSLKQSKTGRMVQNKPEWEVRVINPTPCDFTDMKLSCVGFKSVTPIDSWVVSKSGDTCLLKNGQAIHDFVFKYVWDTSFDFKIVKGYIACS